MYMAAVFMMISFLVGTLFKINYLSGSQFCDLYVGKLGRCRPQLATLSQMYKTYTFHGKIIPLGI